MRNERRQVKLIDVGLTILFFAGLIQAYNLLDNGGEEISPLTPDPNTKVTNKPDGLDEAVDNITRYFGPYRYVCRQKDRYIGPDGGLNESEFSREINDILKDLRGQSNSLVLFYSANLDGTYNYHTKLADVVESLISGDDGVCLGHTPGTNTQETQRGINQKTNSRSSQIRAMSTSIPR